MSKIELYTAKRKKFVVDKDNEINRGGEGSIVALPSDKTLVVKLYHSNISRPTEAQLSYLSCLDGGVFVTPTDILFDSGGVLCGLVMPFVGGGFVPFPNLLNMAYCLRNAIGEDFKYIIAQNLIDAVADAHKNGIVIGDLNQYNIMFDSNAKLKFIDTDSYQTPHNIHSGRLLEDIRDYLYGGLVSAESDFYALAVLVFYLLTNTHPFKGVHKVYKSLQDRILHRIPIFADDAQLVVPKCYRPVSDVGLQSSFVQIFETGGRFLLNLNVKAQGVKGFKKQMVVVEGCLKIQTIISDSVIRDVCFNKYCGYVETDSEFIVYKLVQKGVLSENYRLSKQFVERVFVTNRNVYYVKNDALFLVESVTSHRQIRNIEFRVSMKIHQYDSVLMCVGDDDFVLIYLDAIVNYNLRNERVRAYGQGFTLNTGLFQFAGGVNRVFYNTGKNLASVKISHRIVDLYQRGNFGVVKYLEDDKICVQFFRVDGLDVVYCADKEQDLFHFDVMAGGNATYLVKPLDNKILIVRPSDWVTIASYDVSVVSAQSVVYHTNAGIVAWEGQNLYLLNV